MNYSFIQATTAETAQIWTILQQAIIRRKNDGSEQWQDGYPNLDVVQKDIEKGAGFLLMEGRSIIGYCAVLINDEPEYENIKGKWLSNKDFVVFHRFVISENYLGKGWSIKMIKLIENFARENGVYSIKVDTNFDNHAMLSIFEKLGYSYCGKVYFRGSERKAYEKLLPSTTEKLL